LSLPGASANTEAVANIRAKIAISRNFMKISSRLQCTKARAAGHARAPEAQGCNGAHRKGLDAEIVLQSKDRRAVAQASNELALRRETGWLTLSNCYRGRKCRSDSAGYTRQNRSLACCGGAEIRSAIPALARGRAAWHLPVPIAVRCRNRTDLRQQRSRQPRKTQRNRQTQAQAAMEPDRHGNDSTPISEL
jgi:hypothetical protein